MPLVPIVIIDLNALATLPVGTALAAAATLTAIDILDDQLMENGKGIKNNPQKIDKAEKENRIPIDEPPLGLGDDTNDRRCGSEDRSMRFHYLPLDENKLAQGVNALICPDDLKPTGSARQSLRGVYVYGYPIKKHDRTHILGDRFSGAPISENLFMGTGRMNKSGMKICENLMAEDLEKGNWVEYTATLNYSKGIGIPEGVTMTAYTEEGPLFQTTVRNHSQWQTTC